MRSCLSKMPSCFSARPESFWSFTQPRFKVGEALMPSGGEKYLLRTWMPTSGTVEVVLGPQAAGGVLAERLRLVGNVRDAVLLPLRLDQVYLVDELLPDDRGVPVR